MRLPSVSLEALIGIVGLFVGLVEMNWELRSLGVLVASGLAVHITRRLDATILLKVATGISKACDRAGIECPLAPGHLNSPEDRGIKIYVADMNSPPESAKNLQGVLERLGLPSLLPCILVASYRAASSYFLVLLLRLRRR
jgi:hypothetical protein